MYKKCVRNLVRILQGNIIFEMIFLGVLRGAWAEKDDS
jgi:hypothetical protein